MTVLDKKPAANDVPLKARSDQKSSPVPNDNDLRLPDPALLTQAMSRVWERSQPVLQDFMNRYAEELGEQPLDPMNIREAYLEFLDHVIAKPEKYAELQANYWAKWMQLWQEAGLRALGEKQAIEPVIEPDRGDRRFRAKEWQENSLFDFIKQSYLLTCACVNDIIQETDDLDDAHKKKLKFFAREYANALSPTNFIFTNPDVLKETIKTGGENLIRGFENLIKDIERGHGELKISTTTSEAFKLGENIATTPGQVVFQNDLMQLIQYEPQTKEVYKRPVLVVPPWINKYYILDLKEENSLARYMVDQGHTVFMISWVNPDARLAQKSFENYLNEGVLAALDQIESICGVTETNAVGYCLGGTLLAIAMAYLGRVKQGKRIVSATLLTTLLDFEEAGELKLFLDKEQIRMMQEGMSLTGVFEAKKIKYTFSLLRSNDMIWSFVVNNYLMGREPFPFDLLYWNDDSTNMPAAVHSEYLVGMYRDNLLVQPGGIVLNGEEIDLGLIKTPCYFLSTREDHIAPWKATFYGQSYLGGPTTFVLAASGHVAGVINAPHKNKYCFWTSDKKDVSPEKWVMTAKEHKGSWWPHWQTWTEKLNKDKVKARAITKAIEPAPGSYVKVRSD